MENLGSGGEAKASPADREDTDPIARPRVHPVDDAELGSTMDTALDESDVALDESKGIVGYGETAAYGETVENEPYLDEG